METTGSFTKPVGLDVSGFFNYGIRLTFFCYHNDIESYVCKEYAKVHCNMDDVLFITRENVCSIAKKIAVIIHELNNQLFEEAKPKITTELKYTPVANITFDDVESLMKCGEREVEKVSRKFNVKVKVYKDVLPNGQTYIPQLERNVEKAIIEELLNVIDEMKKEEEFFVPGVCDIVEAMTSASALNPETVKKVIPCRVGDYEKLGIKL